MGECEENHSYEECLVTNEEYVAMVGEDEARRVGQMLDRLGE